MPGTWYHSVPATFGVQFFYQNGRLCDVERGKGASYLVCVLLSKISAQTQVSCSTASNLVPEE